MENSAVTSVMGKPVKKAQHGISAGISRHNAALTEACLLLSASWFLCIDITKFNRPKSSLTAAVIRGTSNFFLVSTRQSEVSYQGLVKPRRCVRAI